MDFDAVLRQIFAENAASFAGLTLTEARPQNTHTRKIAARLVKIKGDGRVQFERFLTDNKAVHQNVPPNEAENLVRELLKTDFKQGIFRMSDGTEFHLTHDKANRPHLRTKSAQKVTNSAPAMPLPMHDRRKNHLLGAETAPIDFLVHLGVQNKSGEIKSGKYDKWKQINRFLEMVDDVARFLPNGSLRVVDFGSGKSYLTFALHYYFTVVKRRNVQIVGLDLKPDVVSHCNEIANDLGISPDTLRFVVGDIANQGGALFGENPVHLVVSLHACDTATDDALVQAASWNAPVVLAVPCCQHELSKVIANPELAPLLKHGLLKERTAALVTDALRAHVLEIAGYEVQVLEFIDMEHTPKNLLLRAVRRTTPTTKAAQTQKIADYKAFCEQWGIRRPYLEAAWEAQIGPLFRQKSEEQESGENQ